MMGEIGNTNGNSLQKRAVGVARPCSQISDFAVDPRGLGGEIELLGQIGLALLSAGAVKYIAQVIVEFVKRHDRYEVKVGDIKISKDHASSADLEAIHKELNRILALRKVTKKSK